jgi:hypothetical protein
LAFLIKAQLLAKEEVLSGECTLGLKETVQKSKNIRGEVRSSKGRMREAFT